MTDPDVRDGLHPDGCRHDFFDADPVAAQAAMDAMLADYDRGMALLGELAERAGLPPPAPAAKSETRPGGGSDQGWEQEQEHEPGPRLLWHRLDAACVQAKMWLNFPVRMGRGIRGDYLIAHIEALIDDSSPSFRTPWLATLEIPDGAEAAGKRVPGWRQATKQKLINEFPSAGAAIESVEWMADQIRDYNEGLCRAARLRREESDATERRFEEELNQQLDGRGFLEFVERPQPRPVYHCGTDQCWRSVDDGPVMHLAACRGADGKLPPQLFDPSDRHGEAA